MASWMDCLLFIAIITAAHIHACGELKLFPSLAGAGS